jgi:hypothetical protein
VPVREVEFRKRRLEGILARAAAISSEEVQADYARHICVLLSGFVEKSVGEIVTQYASDKGSARLRSYVESSLRKLTNVDKQRLLDVVGAFDAAWRIEMENFVIDERQAAINSVVGLRNDIAHGGAASVSLRQISKYWQGVQEIIDKLSEIMLADPRRPVVTRGRRVRLTRVSAKLCT